MPTFYQTAVEGTSKSTPFPNSPKAVELTERIPDQNTTPMRFYVSGDGSKVKLPQSIMNEHVGVNYRTIYNSYAEQNKNEKGDFTLYDDYLRCMNAHAAFNEFMKAKKNPTYENILHYYNDDELDKDGLARYKMQDFIYLKYYNQIPNNHMITLRRYTQPVPDHLFGLDITAESMKELNNQNSELFALATAVTYLGEQTGNKLSEILRFDYGANWETKSAHVNLLNNSDGGLMAQLKQWGADENTLAGTAGVGGMKSGTIATMAFLAPGLGMSGAQMQSTQHQYAEDAFIASYGEEFYGDINTITETSLRARGLTFNNSFDLNFEYSLKSLKCVNPRVAMMDIISNFLLLTGNYGSFWGGETIYYGIRNIAPQFGNPQLLRDGHYGQYLNSLADSVRTFFDRYSDTFKGENGFSWISAVKGILTNGLQSIMGNIFGGNVGVAGQAQAPPALLSGQPTGYWHLTIGNPLDPIAMMGNMKVEKTVVQFNDILGYDDFPTEVKFTVQISHARPRENTGIEAMFNGAKGRFYILSKDVEKSFDINWSKSGNVAGMVGDKSTQEIGNVTPANAENNHGSPVGPFTTGKLKIIGSMLE